MRDKYYHCATTVANHFPCFKFYQRKKTPGGIKYAKSLILYGTSVARCSPVSLGMQLLRVTGKFPRDVSLSHVTPDCDANCCRVTPNRSYIHTTERCVQLLYLEKNFPTSWVSRMNDTPTRPQSPN